MVMWAAERFKRYGRLWALEWALWALEWARQTDLSGFALEWAWALEWA